jgi:hypothetical protein
MTGPQHTPSHPPITTEPPSPAGAAHFLFAAHAEHGFVASFTATIPAHLAAWYLTREQFEPLPDAPGLFRLVDPDRDGVRRTRQAVKDLRHLGYRVHADHTLEPVSSDTSGQARVEERSRRRARIAQAAAIRSPQNTAPHAVPVPAARPFTASPSHQPAVETAAPRVRKSR